MARTSYKTLERLFLVIILASTAFLIFSRPTASGDAPASVYQAVNLVTNVPGRADNTDFLMIDPWGLTSDFHGWWWVADEGSGRVTYYDGTGLSLPVLSPLDIEVPVAPSGVYDYASPSAVVLNESPDFEIAAGIPARLLIATRDGTIAGWNRDANEYESAILVDNAPDAEYTGAAIALRIRNLIYVANFSQDRIEAYNPEYSAVLFGDNAFVDPLMPEAFSPFNIRNIDGVLYVTYAEPGGNEGVAAGDGAGYVDAFDPDGNLVMRFKNGPWMNAPWGIAVAPQAGFGPFSGRLLIGNVGSGRIASFDPLTGAFLGYLPGADGIPLTIPGLHGLAFDDSGASGRQAHLYFTAGIDSGKTSSMGVITESAGPGTRQEVPAPVPGMGY